MEVQWERIVGVQLLASADEDRGLETWSIDYPQVLLRDDHERLLRESDFEKIEFFGSYDFKPYDKSTSDWLIAVACK